MIPRLKPVAWERVGTEVHVVSDPRERIVLEDPDGVVEQLLTLLRDGGRDLDMLAAELSRSGTPVDSVDLADAIDGLNELRLIEDERRLGVLPQVAQNRYVSNLEFFRTFTDLAYSAEDVQLRLREAHVLQLGVGGLGSNVLQNLCGLGIGRLTLLDRDTVELGNFARQFVYRRQDVARSKVDRAAEWVREFDPAIAVSTIQADLGDAAAVADVVRRTNPDLVVAGVDRPLGIDRWVNSACVGHGVPFIRAGMFVTQALVWSVHPGHSACYECPAETDGGDVIQATLGLFGQLPTVNRGIGPVASLLGALVSFEALRYLTGIMPPAFAGRLGTLDLRSAGELSIADWPRNPDCPVCLTAGAGRRAAGGTGASETPIPAPAPAEDRGEAELASSERG